EARAERGASLGVAVFAEGPHDVDAEVRVRVVEEILEGLAAAAIAHELGKRGDGGATRAGRMTVTRRGEEMGRGSVATQRGEAVDGGAPDHVGPRRSLEEIAEGVEARALAGAAERTRRFGLDEVARVFEGVGPERFRGAGRAKAPQGGD